MRLTVTFHWDDKDRKKVIFCQIPSETLADLVSKLDPDKVTCDTGRRPRRRKAPSQTRDYDPTQPELFP